MKNRMLVLKFPFTREFDAFTRELGFTREFRPFIREIDAFTREF